MNQSNVKVLDLVKYVNNTKLVKNNICNLNSCIILQFTYTIFLTDVNDKLLILAFMTKTLLLSFVLFYREIVA